MFSAVRARGSACMENAMFKRIALPYEYDALEPYIDAETISVHYDKHHKTYTDNFNELVRDVPAFASMDAEEILMHLDKAPKNKQAAIRNNGGGFFNHNLYFESLIPGGKRPTSALAKKLDADLGGLDKVEEKLFNAATSDLFGSGWAWLIVKNGELDVVISRNQDNPLNDGNPNVLLPLDMWEHAYYLKHKNDKKAYVKDFFKVVNWGKVEERLEMAVSTVSK